MWLARLRIARTGATIWSLLPSHPRLQEEDLGQACRPSETPAVQGVPLTASFEVLELQRWHGQW